MNNLTITIVSVFLFSIILTFTNGAQSDKEKDLSKATQTAQQQQLQSTPVYNPLGPLVLCSFLPLEFLECDEIIDHHGNETAKELSKDEGCLKFGGVKFEDVERTFRKCRVLSGIDCHGPTDNIIRHGFPCIRYSDHYFVTTLLYSILLGFIGMDRFCLGQTGTAVGKLLTLGGVGIWWIIDIVLLITNNLMPEDGSNWNPNV